MTDYTVDPEQLRTHASTLTGYADQLTTIGTRLPDSLGEEPLGAFAQFLTTGLGSAMTATMAAFSHAASTVDMVSGGLRQAADEYQRTDDGNAAALTGITADLGEGAR